MLMLIVSIVISGICVLLSEINNIQSDKAYNLINKRHYIKTHKNGIAFNLNGYCVLHTGKVKTTNVMSSWYTIYNEYYKHYKFYSFNLTTDVTLNFSSVTKTLYRYIKAGYDFQTALSYAVKY